MNTALRRMGLLAALGASLSLLAIWLWLGWWNYSRLGLIGAGVASLPLIALLPGLWRLHLRTQQLGSMLAVLYLAWAAMEVFATGRSSAAGGLLVCSSLWFAASLLYCRGELRRLQHLRQQSET